MKVLIAEDHALVRQGIAALLSLHADEVLEADDGARALQLLQSSEIDIALLDIGLPSRTGLDILQEARKRRLPTKIIVLTGDTDHYAPSDIYAAGADAFLYKTADADHLLEVFDAVRHGEVATQMPDQGNTAATLRNQLTDREQQIVKLIVEGHSNKDAAELLSISEHTVRKHREHIKQKLSASTPAALAAFAIKTGLV